MKNITTPIAAMISRPVESMLQNGCTAMKNSSPITHEVELLVEPPRHEPERPGRPDGDAPR